MNRFKILVATFVACAGFSAAAPAAQDSEFFRAHPTLVFEWTQTYRDSRMLVESWGDTIFLVLKACKQNSLGKETCLKFTESARFHVPNGGALSKIQKVPLNPNIRMEVRADAVAGAFAKIESENPLARFDDAKDQILLTIGFSDWIEIDAHPEKKVFLLKDIVAGVKADGVFQESFRLGYSYGRRTKGIIDNSGRVSTLR